MQKILIDSSIIEYHLKGENTVTQFLQSMLLSGSVPAISSATEYDLFTKPAIEKTEHLCTPLLDELTVFPISSSIARLAGKIKTKNNSIEFIEALVAATALEQGHALVTLEAEKYTSIPGLLILGVPGVIQRANTFPNHISGAIFYCGHYFIKLVFEDNVPRQEFYQNLRFIFIQENSLRLVNLDNTRKYEIAFGHDLDSEIQSKDEYPEYVRELINENIKWMDWTFKDIREKIDVTLPFVCLHAW